MNGGARSVGLIGARGYTGVELMSLLGQHTGFELAMASSRAFAGHSVKDQVPGFEGTLQFHDCTPENVSQQDLDVIVLALPNGVSQQYLAVLQQAKRRSVILDLSADHRFAADWHYGLPELNRAAADGQTRIANPGCYATAMQLALAPVLDVIDGTPHCFGVSGYSGAGTTPSEKNDPERLANNLIPYAPIGHIHERETSLKLGRRVRFLPHVAAFFRGINMTVTTGLRQALSIDEVRARYATAYRDEALIRLDNRIPQVAASVGMHHACVGGWQLSDDGLELVVFSTLDNLLKGAATQAIQNLNLACGYDELEGIPHA